MSLYSVIRSIASDWAEARRAAETARLLGSLPMDIRKDIGWPSEDAGPVRLAGPAGLRSALH